MFYIEMYRENLKNLLQTKYKPLSLDIKHVALCSGPLPRLHKLCPWGQDWPLPRGHIFNIEIYRENLRNLFLIKYETSSLDIWCEALSSDPYQDCINYVPRVKIAPAPGVTYFT